MTAPSGWHPDHNDTSLERYWDGNEWTDQTRHVAADTAALPTSAATASGHLPVASGSENPWRGNAKSLNAEALAKRKSFNKKILGWTGGILAALFIIGSCAGGPEDTVQPVAAPTESPTPEVEFTFSPTPSPTPSPTAIRPLVNSPKPRPVTTRPPATRPPAPAAESYANCTELRKDYPGGVAEPGATNRGGATKRTPKYSQALYDANSGSDRDGDGIACEA